MQQRLPGAFPSNKAFGFPQPINVADTGGSATSSTWGVGGACIFTLPLQPPLSERWSIVAFTISWCGIIAPINVNAGMFGRLGRLLGGIAQGALNSASVSSGVPIVWTNPVLSLPQDTSSIVTLYDPLQEPAWAQFTAPQPSPQDTQTVVLNSPLQISSGESVSMGLWLEPFLAQNITPFVANATYTIVYDDGHKNQPPWGDW